MEKSQFEHFSIFILIKPEYDILFQIKSISF